MATNTSDVRQAFTLRDSAALARHRQWRKFKDQLARYLVVVGGLAVIAALLLIFAYLFYVVIPLFKPASIEPVAEYAVPGGAEARTAGLAMQEHAEVGARFTADGGVIFFDTRSGEPVAQQRLPIPPDVEVTSFAESYQRHRVVAFGLSDGRALVVRHNYRISYPDGRRFITPELEYPLGEEPVEVSQDGTPLTTLAVQLNEDGASLVGAGPQGRLFMAAYQREESFLTGDVEWEGDFVSLPQSRGQVTDLLLTPLQDRLYVILDHQELKAIDVSDKTEGSLIERLKLTEGEARVTAATFLAGGGSLLIGTSTGAVAQWVPVRGSDNEFGLVKVRDFQEQEAPITAIAIEEGRRGFAAADASGNVAVYHTTAHRVLKHEQVAAGPITGMAMGPRADSLLIQEEGGKLDFVRLHNEHPEVSWNALWGQVWYEGYDRPLYLWQSSAATNDFEPKFSLAPLSFGTLKAAFYAMLFAVPLGIMGAIYTAYFMAPAMRKLVKPTVEIMEALPTVILGFLAGLWLAPFAEENLPGFAALFILLPLGVVAFSYLWSRLPLAVRSLVPEGWQAALLIPVIIVIAGVSFALSPLLEEAFFDGNVRLWLTNVAGIDFDQRNAFVVGMAMGFAVIPTIFSIAEDAIFSVPKHLTFGALALGSTPWQSLTRVVLLTASPGIFSAVMIGLGRAVGETMIVLMATGNTPVMDWSIFQGMRTLSANIAVEMPESEVDSTHYRVLFLAGLVLFVFTFFFNTMAEIVRQRLRGKYSQL